MAQNDKKSEKKAKKKLRKRSERRFLPESSQNRGLVGGLGGVGATALGAGMYGQLYAKHYQVSETATVNPMMALTITGAALVMAAVWLGTSADASMVVGSGGIGLEKNKDTKRIPWHGLKSLSWEESDLTLVIEGRDDSGAPMTIRANAKQHGRACAWVLKEAMVRTPELTKDLPENLAERLPEASDDSGDKVELDALHVVGRRCAVSNEIIAYEPDARVCTRCERVYHKDHVPSACACGNVLGEEPAAA